MQRPFELHFLSRRSLLMALVSTLPVRGLFAQDVTVSSSDAEKAAHDYLADLTADEKLGESFWYLDRNFNRELDTMGRSNQATVAKLKQQWSATIETERDSKRLEVEAFSSDTKVQKAWEKRHPGFAYSDPSHPCWLVFRKGVKINSVSAGEKEADFEDQKIWVHVPLQYVNKDDSPVLYNFVVQREQKLQKAKATLWIEKPDRNAHLYVYDQCWLSDIEPWT